MCSLFLSNLRREDPSRFLCFFPVGYASDWHPEQENQVVFFWTAVAGTSASVLEAGAGQAVLAPAFCKSG